MDITAFCQAGGYREYLRSPFNIGNRTIATNGHIMVSVPLRNEHPPLEDDGDLKDGVIKLLRHHPKYEFQPLPEGLEIPEMEDCRTCKGTGKALIQQCLECDGDGLVELENDFNSYEAECKTCDGHGERVTAGGDEPCAKCQGTGKNHRAGVHVSIFGVPISPAYLERVSALGEVKFHGLPEERMLLFKAGEAEGVVMAMTKSVRT